MAIDSPRFHFSWKIGVILYLETNKKATRKWSFGTLLIGSFGAFPLIFILLLMVIISLVVLFATDDSETYNGICRTEGSVDMDAFTETLSQAGVFAGMEDTFIEVANKYEIDPVLLAAIAIHETGWGKSNLVVNKNNPGGLYNSSAGTFYSFDTLEEGLDMMGKTLHKHVVLKSLNTVEKLGSVYAPVGAANDPNNLNANWVTAVTNIATKLGGFTMNCEYIQNLGGSFNIPTESPFHVNGHYGWRNMGGSKEFHLGIDLHCALGEGILAAREGTVITSSSHYSYGNYVVIRHDDGYTTLYAHLSRRLVDVGDRVNAGQRIGLCGSTGRSTGPHLHFEVRLPNGERTDPYPYLVGN